jgi:hypothetical protein
MAGSLKNLRCALRHLSFFPTGPRFQRFDGPRLIEVEHFPMDSSRASYSSLAPVKGWASSRNCSTTPDSKVTGITRSWLNLHGGTGGLSEPDHVLGCASAALHLLAAAINFTTEAFSWEKIVFQREERRKPVAGTELVPESADRSAEFGVGKQGRQSSGSDAKTNNRCSFWWRRRFLV